MATDIPEYILVIASSGRMLAQSAKKAQFKPLVIDLFADTDLRYYAYDFLAVPSLSIENLVKATRYFVDQYAVADVIYGSGFEAYPESLFYLQSMFNILGNDPVIFKKLHEKQSFFSALDRLAIVHPKVRFTAPDQKDHWLVKPMQGQGGFGIKYYHHHSGEATALYWQQYQQGCPLSVLFLANGNTMQVIGFNSQWTIRARKNEPFVFSGAMNHAKLLPEHKRRISEWLDKLVVFFELRGLNSLDFIQDGDKSYVLEINPRPPASMQLYDNSNLLMAHFQASRGILGEYKPDRNGYKAFQVAYAECGIAIPDAFEWPENCMDLPAPGSIISIGQPICSIIAHQKEVQTVLDQLADTQKTIINQLERFQSDAI